MLFVVCSLSANTDLQAAMIYELTDGDSYAGLAGRMIIPSCLAGSKFEYWIDNMICIVVVGSCCAVMLVKILEVSFNVIIMSCLELTFLCVNILIVRFSPFTGY